MHEIGMMTNYNTPPEIAKMTALVAKAYGIELIYMRPRDINIEEKRSMEEFWLTTSGWIKKQIYLLL